MADWELTHFCSSLIYGLSYVPSSLLLSDGLLDWATSGADTAVDSAEASAFAFFFFADLDSSLTAGFWVAEAAIVMVVGMFWWFFGK